MTTIKESDTFETDMKDDFCSNDLSNKDVKISLTSSVLLLAGTIIGTGIFMTPNNVVKEIPSIFYSLLTWIFCGIVALLAALCYSELGLEYPSIGGEYTYFREIYPPIFSFIYLMTNFFLIRPVSIAIPVLFFSEVILSIIFEDSSKMFWICRVCSIVTIILICLLNCLSERLTIGINNVLTYLKFVCMAVIIGLGIYKLSKGEFENIKDPGFIITVSASNISGAVFNGMWAYDGFNQLGYIVDKMKNKERNLVKATVIGMSLVIFFYAVINWSYLVILGVTELGNSSNVAQSVTYPFLKKYTVIITIMVALSSLATANSTSYSGGNLYFEAAKNGHFPRLFAAIHNKTKTYIPALFLQTLIIILYLISAPNMEVLLMYFSGASWLFYSLIFAGLLIFRFQNRSISKPFKLWIFIPFVTLAISIFIVILGFLQDWVQALISVSLIIGSIPTYFLFVYKDGIIPKFVKKAFDNFTTRVFNKFSLYAHVEGAKNKN